MTTAARWTSPVVMAAAIKLADRTGIVLHTELTQATQLTALQVTGACNTLRRRGWLDKSGRARRQGVYRVTQAGRAAHERGEHEFTSGPAGRLRRPLKNTTRERVWRLLRIRRKLSVQEAVGLLTDAGASDADITRMAQNLYKFFGLLAQAGYLAQMPSSNGPKRYLLIRDSGPETPCQRQGQMYDPNTEGFHELA